MSFKVTVEASVHPKWSIMSIFAGLKALFRKLAMNTLGYTPRSMNEDERVENTVYKTKLHSVFNRRYVPLVCPTTEYILF